MSNLPLSSGYQLETIANTEYDHSTASCRGERVYWKEMGSRLISLLVGQRPTKAMISSRPERVIGHIGTENGPDSYGRQQSGILGNGGNSDPAIPRGG